MFSRFAVFVCFFACIVSLSYFVFMFLLVRFDLFAQVNVCVCTIRLHHFFA